MTKSLFLPIENEWDCKNSAFLILCIPAALVGSIMHRTMVASFLQEKETNNGTFSGLDNEVFCPAMGSVMILQILSHSAARITLCCFTQNKVALLQRTGHWRNWKKMKPRSTVTPCLPCCRPHTAASHIQGKILRGFRRDQE